MDDYTTQLVKESFDLVEPIAPRAAELFYANLFALDPSLQALFKSDMVVQGEKLMKMIGVAVGLLDKPQVLIPALQGLGPTACRLRRARRALRHRGHRLAQYAAAGHRRGLHARGARGLDRGLRGDLAHHEGRGTSPGLIEPPSRFAPAPKGRRPAARQSRFRGRCLRGCFATLALARS